MTYKFLITFTLHKTTPHTDDDRGLDRATMAKALTDVGAIPVGDTCWILATPWDIDGVYDRLSPMLRTTDDLFIVALLNPLDHRGRGYDRNRLR